MQHVLHQLDSSTQEGGGKGKARKRLHTSPAPSIHRSMSVPKNHLRSPASRAFASVVALFPALCRRSSLVAFVLPSIGFGLLLVSSVVLF
jgi:hypothetical protein